MELLCPNCQQKLNIPDQYAGQLMRCPLCNGMFQAPTTGSGAPPPPPVYTPPPTTAPAPFFASGMAPSSPPPPPSVPLPPPQEATKCCALVISPRVVPWIAPLGLVLILILSFLPWIPVFSLNVWRLAFGTGSSLMFTFYVIFLLLALVLAIPSFLFAVELVPVPDGIRAMGPWRPVVVGLIALASFVFLYIQYLKPFFQIGYVPALVPWKTSLWIHKIVLLGLALEIWLERRRLANLGPPRIEFHR